MSIAAEITRLTTLRNRLRAKLSTLSLVAANADLEDCVEAVEGLEPDSTVPENDVNFIDYDGTIVASYTAAEFASLTALPANPSHTGLTAQGWNWTLADAKAYVASYGKLWIGQMYITDDGKTRIYIHLEEGRLSPYLGLAVNGTAVIDWGDESATDTVTGADITAIVNTQHTYAAAGEYVISINVTDGTAAIIGTGSLYSQLLWAGAPANGPQSTAYRSAIRAVEIGSDCSIGNHAFNSCYSLTSVTIPSSVTSLGFNAFYLCYSLKSVTLPSGITAVGDYAFYYNYSLKNAALPNSVTTMGSYVFGEMRTVSGIAIPDSVTSVGHNTFVNCSCLATIAVPNSVTSISNSMFSGCSNLASITIPSSVTAIAANGFSGCRGLGRVKFEGTTPPTVAASSAWNNLPYDCVIYVPRGSLSAYKSATNYPNSGFYSYVEYD